MIMIFLDPYVTDSIRKNTLQNQKVETDDLRHRVSLIRQ